MDLDSIDPTNSIDSVSYELPKPLDTSADTKFVEDNSVNLTQTKTAAKSKTSPLRLSTYVIGGVAVAMLIASIFLLVFLRQSEEVIVYPQVSVTPGSPGYVPLPPRKLVAVSEAEAPNTYQDILKLDSVTPVVSITVSTNFPTIPPTVTPQDVPGDEPFADTLSLPLQIPPAGYGFCVATPTADSWFTSFQNMYSIVGQYISTTSKTQKWGVYSDAYKQGDNAILFNCPSDGSDGSTTASSPNDGASSVGSVGFYSMAVSPDGLRLYVAYRTPYMGNSANSTLFPMFQLCGRVAVFTRPIDNTTDPNNPTSTSLDWTFNCTLQMSNPFGSQVSGPGPLTNPVTGILMTGDDFGSTIKTSRNLSNGNRMVAIRANYGYIQSNGALITIQEELSTQVMVVSANVQASTVGQSLSLNERLAFGQDFDIGNDTLIAAIRVTGLPYRLAYFHRDATTLDWSFKCMLTAPSTTEDFGVSIIVSPQGDMLIVGAPTLPNGVVKGNGGHIYVYHRSDDKTHWTLEQTVSDPKASVNTGAYGYFLSVDPQFLVLSTSANQTNVLNVLPPTRAVATSAQYSQVQFLAIDQINRKLDTSSVQQVPQQGPDTDYNDPLFGCNLSMAFDSNIIGTLNILLNSPMNQSVYYVSMGL